MKQTGKFSARVLTICIVFQQLFTIDGGLSTRPTNTETVQGHSIRLNCSTTDPYFVNWQHTPCGAKQREFVYFGGEVVAPYHHRFRVIHDQETGQYDLVIESVQLNDAGTYWCTDREGMGERAEAELLVLKSPPICTCEQCAAGGRACYASKTKSQSSVSCSLSYLGNIAPTLSCPSEMQSIPITTESEGVTTVKYVPQYSEDTRILSIGNRCHTSLSGISSNTFEAIATTVDENYEMSRTVIDQPGELVCEFRTERVCRFKWIRTDKNNETVSTNRWLYVEEPGIYLCEADCSESKFPCKIQPLEVELVAKAVTYYDNSEKLALAIGVSVGITACVALAIAVTLIAHRRRKEIREKARKLRPLLSQG